MVYTFGWIFLTGTFTHHLRDAIRHGFWLSPFVFQTKPVSLWLYVIILSIFPVISSWTMDIIAHVILQRNARYKLLPVDIV